MEIVPQVKQDMCGWKLGRVTAVVDRRFSPAGNLRNTGSQPSLHWRAQSAIGRLPDRVFLSAGLSAATRGIYLRGVELGHITANCLRNSG